jgi:hypothetical protein
VRRRFVDLLEVVKRRFSVVADKSTLVKWPHQLGLTRLQPPPVHPKKHPAAETAFRKLQHPGYTKFDRCRDLLFEPSSAWFDRCWGLNRSDQLS